MQQPVTIYGAGGHARVVLELLEEDGRTVRYFCADNPETTSLLGYPVHGAEAALFQGTEVVIAIGDNGVRRTIARRLQGPFAKALHRNSYVSSRASLGEGTVAMSGATVNTGAHIGAHCIVNTRASVDHDCRIGDFAHIAPGATLCGHVDIGEGALVGAGAVIVPKVRIGRWAVIGAGAIIRNDVPDGATVVGNPGRIFFITKNIPDGSEQ
jgi:sugar O-acyltransferase (sialic acid O-acetyltransferase NeuD family)